ncbi:MAG: hypothetical protein KAY15_04190 [Polaromonas sp.]|jgi:hypothetical protein|nr:hypothetical protein [Polaromonas sp.]
MNNNTAPQAGQCLAPSCTDALCGHRLDSLKQFVACVSGGVSHRGRAGKQL